MDVLNYSLLCERIRALDRDISHTDYPLLTHRLHPYPARFLPQLSFEAIISLTDEGDTVCDPMMGCGTVLEVAAGCGRKAVGCDINPLGSLIAGSVLGDSEAIRTAAAHFVETLQKGLRNGAAADYPLPTRKDFHNWHLWYERDTLRELNWISGQIEEASPAALRSILKVLLSRVARAASKADRRDLYPQRNKQENKAGARKVMHLIAEQASEMLNTIGSFNPHRFSGSAVVRGDVRSLPLKDASVHLIFTSPPYFYAMEYIRVHQLSLSILGFVREDLQNLHRLDLGSRRGKSGSITEYLASLRQSVAEWHRVLKPGCHVAVVVGHSAVNPRDDSLPRVMERMLSEQGFVLKLQESRRYRRRRMTPERRTGSGLISADEILLAVKPC